MPEKVAETIPLEVAVPRPATLTAQHDDSGLYTIPETAGLLRCSDMHVYRLIAAGELRAVDIANAGAGRSKTRVSPDDLADYIDRKRGRKP